MADLTRLTKVELVDLIERLRSELVEARSTHVAGGTVSSEVARWVAGLDLTAAAGPIAVLAEALAARVDAEYDAKAVAQLARELRAAMVEIRELVPADDDAGDEADPVAEAVARRKALRLAP